jgi:hypothetical protein
MRILRSQVSLNPIYARGMRVARRKTENDGEKYLLPGERFELWKKWSYLAELLPEKSFAQLIAADEGLGAAIATKKILNFAVLVDLLRGANRLTGKNL